VRPRAADDRPRVAGTACASGSPGGIPIRRDGDVPPGGGSPGGDRSGSGPAVLPGAPGRPAEVAGGWPRAAPAAPPASRLRDNLGAHVSIAGGLPLALHRGVAAGCGVVQIFLKNQVQWAGRRLDEAEVVEFRRAQAATGLGAFAHATYLINLATPDPAEWTRAVAALADELERAERLGLPFVVVHGGAHKGAGREAGVGQLVRALDELGRRTAGWRVRIALENSAGGGSLLGARAEDVGAVFARVACPERLALCLDTCHLFAAGHDIRTPRGFAAALAGFERAVGLERLVAFHLNDARAPLGSALDRHAHIGEGGIGLAAFRYLLTHPRFRRLPMVLETPKQGDADLRNLATLRRLRGRGRA
jgi:deoxyribonuclease-4